MAAGKTYKGKNLRIRIAGEVIFHATECSFTTEREVEGVASKDTNGQINTAGNYTWGISTNYLVADKAVASTDEDTKSLLEKYQDGTPVAVEFTTNETGDLVISGNAIIRSINLNAGTTGVATGDAQFTGDGDFEVDTV